MILPDVNVLMYAFEPSSRDHVRYRAWLDSVVNGDEAFGISELVLSAVVRILTNPRAYSVPTSLERVFEFTDGLRVMPQCVVVRPGPRHWDIFSDLCRRVEARGNTVPDAYHAALAIESGSEWITEDRGFARFPGLRWRRPFD